MSKSEDSSESRKLLLSVVCGICQHEQERQGSSTHTTITEKVSEDLSDEEAAFILIVELFQNGNFNPTERILTPELREGLSRIRRELRTRLNVCIAKKEISHLISGDADHDEIVNECFDVEVALAVEQEERLLREYELPSDLESTWMRLVAECRSLNTPQIRNRGQEYLEVELANLRNHAGEKLQENTKFILIEQSLKGQSLSLYRHLRESKGCIDFCELRARADHWRLSKGKALESVADATIAKALERLSTQLAAFGLRVRLSGLNNPPIEPTAELVSRPDE